MTAIESVLSATMERVKPHYSTPLASKNKMLVTSISLQVFVLPTLPKSETLNPIQPSRKSSVEKGRQFQELEEEIAAIEAQMIDPSFYEGDWEPIMERYSELQQMLASSGGGNVAGIAKGILERLGLDKHPMDMKVSALSGGEKAKLALARQLVGLAGVDVIFLDEPTNHLDIQTTEWLEAFLRDFKGAQLIVSHDRYFLDQVCTRIVEVDNLRAWPWKGNYSQFVKLKAQVKRHWLIASRH